MPIFRAIDYDNACRDHALEIPATFNFATDVIDHHADASDGLALIWCNDRGAEIRMTFSDVRDASSRLANLLRRLGADKGDRIIVMLPRIPQWQIALVACLRIGAIPIPCITMLTSRDIAYRARQSGAIGVITLREETPKFEGLTDLAIRLAVDRQERDDEPTDDPRAPGAPGTDGWVAVSAADGEPRECVPATVAAGDPAIIYYTSGSTGNPKGVCHSSRSLYCWRVSAWYWLSLGPDDIIWCTADTGWSKAGTSIIFGPWSQGATVLFYDGPFDPAERLALVARHRVNVFCAAATELRRLVSEPVGKHDLSALRMTVSAGESVNPEILSAWQAASGVPLLDGYGQTETLMTVLNYPGMPVRAGSMGKPLPGVACGVLLATGRLGNGTCEGQLVVRGDCPQLMSGYWREPERTATAFVTIDGVSWFLTGDNVRRDRDGYLYFVGRSDDMINSSGYRIGPQEVENALIEHPAVRESAVIGVPDPERGERVKALVVLEPGRAGDARLAAELQAHVKRVTAPYKYPREIEFVTDLPKTVSGKIQRNRLRDDERRHLDS